MSLFEKVLVKKPKRSRLDLSHGNSVSLRWGMLTPTEVRFIVPGDEVSVSMEQIVRLAPLPVPTFVNMKVRHDWFFVPLTLMYDKGAMDLLLGTQSSRNRARVATLADYVSLFTSVNSPLVPSSIHDYLTYPVVDDRNLDPSEVVNLSAFITSPTQTNYDNIFATSTNAYLVAANTGPLTIEPLLAYHYIWRDYYRFTGVQVDTTPGVESWLENHVFAGSFANSALTSSSTFTSLVNAHFRHRGANAGTETWMTYLGVPYYAHYKKDMFTSVRYGTKPVVLIPTGASGNIPNLREASAIQRFIDVISVAGQRYWDKVPALYDVVPEGMKDERVKFLARYQSFVKVGEVITTATTAQAETGDYAGRGLLVDGKYLFRRRFTEHGWLMCISSIVPDLHYTGLSRQISDVNMLDTPIPSLAQVGDQSVFRREMFFSFASNSDNASVMGDQFRYYAYKSAPSEVHGDFKMKSFEAWTASFTDVGNSIIDATKVRPSVWNRVFNLNSDAPVFGSRFFLDLTFHEFINRALPKYINYSL